MEQAKLNISFKWRKRIENFKDFLGAGRLRLNHFTIIVLIITCISYKRKQETFRFIHVNKKNQT